MFNINLESGLYYLTLSPTTCKSLGQIWNVIPKFKRNSLIKKGESIFTFETTTGLRNIQSPMAGKVADWAETICEDMPERINDETVLLVLTGVNP